MYLGHVFTGGFKVGHLPTSPFEGVRHSGTSASNSSGAAAGGSGGPFASRVVRMSTNSMDTTNSNSGHQSGNHTEHFRGLASSASQKEQDRSPRGRDSSFDTLQQQHLQV